MSSDKATPLMEQYLKTKQQYMSKIENIEQYNWAVNRVEELLQVVKSISVLPVSK